MKILIEQIKKQARILGVGALLVGASFAQTASAGFSTHNLLYTGCLATGECYAGITPPIPKANSSCATDLTQVRWNVANGGAEMSRAASAALLAGKTISFDTIQTQCLGGFARLAFLHVNR